MTFSWFRRHRVASIAGALTAVVIVAVAVVVVVAARDMSAGPIAGSGTLRAPGPLAFSFRLELTAWPGSFVARPDAGVYVTAGTPSCP